MIFTIQIIFIEGNFREMQTDNLAETMALLWERYGLSIKYMSIFRTKRGTP